ncbi:hypothetical protein BV20DRAFT_497716 [Pilatotrama ljubarskyi]|nr:hypothetical protein BV20DRAFT_497716 [Pilatotrama ljubarskyi]
MPAPLDRESLKNMKRADLQRICKDYGIKANLKTEALIDLLIDTTQARPRPTPPVPQRAPSGRTVSRSLASGSRLRGSSSSSVIIHDTDEEDNATEEEHHRSLAPAPSSESEAPPPPRTRKAKETQYRLGVGRPTVAGGSGARAVTRSSSFSARGKHGKGTRSAKPTEDAIQEEEEPDPMEPDMPEAGPSGTTHDHDSPPPLLPNSQEHQTTTSEPASDTPDHLKAYIADLVTPLRTQIELLQSELRQRLSHEAGIALLTSQLQSIQAEVQSLRSQAAMALQLQNEVQQLKSLVSELVQRAVAGDTKQSAKSLGKARASDETSSQTTVAGSDLSMGGSSSIPQMAEYPGMAQSLLGKRHRDTDDSHVTDVVEAGQEGLYSQADLEKLAVRPTKKRIKLSEDGQSESQQDPSGHPEASAEPQHGDGEVQPAARPPPVPFTVFSGPEEPPESFNDPPPPTTHLSDLFPLSSGIAAHTPNPANGAGTIARPIGSDENATNQLGFNFSFNTSIFQPVTSTPYDMGHPAFAYPEPPTSPTPGVPSGGFIERAGGRIERNDLYHPHGRRHAQSQAQAEGQSQTQSRPQSAASRPASRAAPVGATGSAGTGVSGDGTVDPSALSSTPRASQQAGTSTTGMTNGASLAPQTRRIPSSSEIGMAFGMTSSLPLPPETPAPPMKRTMYGTELDGDTRFGDFGVEGVATGFWAGLAPRF